MCCSNCDDTSEPSEIPSSTSTVWVRIGGTASGRPAIAAMPTAIMAPEISPPGRPAHRNSAPPAAPIASVSSTWRILARLGMANAIDARIRLTLPYGKSRHGGQMRHAHAAMHAPGYGVPLPLPQHRYHFAFSAAAFLHWERNFLRSLPLSPLASASFEHSSEAAVRGFSAFFSAGAIFGAGVAAGAGVAGAVVCANAEPISSRDTTAVAARREEIIVIESTSG